MSSVQFKGDAIPDKLERQFKQATKALSGIPKESAVQLSTSDKLSLYALHSQATKGPCTEREPAGLLDAVRHARWSAWKKLRNMSKSDAMERYVQGVRDIALRYPDSPDAARMLRRIDALADGESEASLRQSVAARPAAEADTKENLAPAPAERRGGTRKSSAPPAGAVATPLVNSLAAAPQTAAPLAADSQPPTPLAAIPLNPTPLATSPAESSSGLVVSDASSSVLAASTGSAINVYSAPAVLAMSSGSLASTESGHVAAQLRELEEQFDGIERHLGDAAAVPKEKHVAAGGYEKKLELAGNVAATAITIGAAYVIGGWLRLYRR